MAFSKRYRYKDINLSFEKHPLTDDVLIATDAEAIKKSLRHLVQTNFYEMPFDPDMGSNIRGSLFENFTPIATEFFKRKLYELIERYEPRVDLIHTRVIQRDDLHSLEVTITFRIKTLQLEESFSIFVERTR